MARHISTACLAIGILLAASAAAGCASYGSSAGAGHLAGNVTVGPLTPVERVGVPPPAPSPEVFTSSHLVLYLPDGVTQLQEIPIEAAGDHGVYDASLPPGTYVLGYPRQGVGGARGLPAKVTIEAGKTTRADVDIDTGIR